MLDEVVPGHGVQCTRLLVLVDPRGTSLVAEVPLLVCEAFDILYHFLQLFQLDASVLRQMQEAILVFLVLLDLVIRGW